MSSLPLPLPPPPPPQSQTDPSLDPGASSPAGGKKKRGGAPKAKGAVRAKSGCYTCRIRRKKCDEQPDRDGNCQTCVRLRLECLGFGAKRPDWMRENNSVQELREKIKQFLASQGMIKGHSGGGVRPADQDPSVLNLSTEPGVVTHGNPPSSAMPHPMGDPHRPGPRMPPISSVREHEHMGHFPGLPGGHPFPPPPGQGHPPPLGPHPSHHPHPPPPLVGSMPVHLDPELAYMPPSFGQPHPPQQQQQQQQSRPTISSIPASPWPSAPTLPPSSFGASYNIHDDYFNNQVQESSPTGSEVVPTVPHEIALSPFPYNVDTQETMYVYHYMNNVLRIQYLLADPSSIEPFIFRFAQTSDSARSAMCLLAAVHQQRMRRIRCPDPADPDTEEMDRLFRQTSALLKQTRTYTEGDAMAGLHVVSCFLFTGGHGPWSYFLQVAIYWVGSVLTNDQYNGALDAYQHCTESEQFIIRTTMWFDVWSAVTRRTQPRFRDIYRELFRGEHGYAGPRIGGVDMLPVMGCTNETVLAMSETACLAHWKDMHKKDLSMVELIERGGHIEREYLSRRDDAQLTAPHRGTDDLDMRRRLAANVFRSSTRVYLHSVLSGCLPNVGEIRNGVAETVGYLERVRGSEGASRSVVRSVVLSIALCGCMTDDIGHRKFLSSCLTSLAGQEVEVLGNCSQAKKLMAQVWERRDGGDATVDWRDVIREMSADLLLV